MVPSGSDDADASKLHERLVHEAVNWAAGGAFSAMTLTSSTLKVTGAVVEPERNPRSPTPPRVWRAGSASVTWRSHGAGSAVPARHTLAAMVVGFAPVMRTRTVNLDPGTNVRPVAGSVDREVSPDPVTLATLRKMPPPGAKR